MCVTLEWQFLEPWRTKLGHQRRRRRRRRRLCSCFIILRLLWLRGQWRVAWMAYSYTLKMVTAYSSKIWWTSTKLHGVPSQIIILFAVTAVRTSALTKKSYLKRGARCLHHGNPVNLAMTSAHLRLLMTCKRCCGTNSVKITTAYTTVGLARHSRAAKGKRSYIQIASYSCV
jgi:hypothetical protein